MIKQERSAMFGTSLIMVSTTLRSLTRSVWSSITLLNTSETLNKHLLQGPDLTNNLTGVLCRFRQELIAFICDIEAMFHQVKVNEEHRDLLCFLWWEDADLTKEPKEHRMTVDLFRATLSPGCANFASKVTANDFEREFGTTTADFLHNNFYVDDSLKSVSSVEEAVKLIANVKQMCNKGGFRLHKFMLNSKKVIRRPRILLERQ